MWWNRLVLSDLFKLQAVYCFFFPPLVLWDSGDNSPWFSHYSCFWEYASCSGREDQPWSSWMPVAVSYEWKFYSRLYCFKLLDGFPAPIQVTIYWISPLGYTRQYLSIQGGHKKFWCKLLLNFSGHVGIVHQGHLWYLTYISIDEGVACWFIFKKAPIFINTGFCCSIEDGI